MKVVILAGGFGTRISEESQFRPKPMIELGGMPILWHIMKLYSFYGYNDFIICAGYKQEVIKEYFANYFLHTSDITFDFSLGEQKIIVRQNTAEPWRVTVVNTGLNTMTGGRVKRIMPYLQNERFMLTYGDGVSDVNISLLEQCHVDAKKLVTLTAYNNAQRFGMLEIRDDGSVAAFREKAGGDGALINAGYMVCEPGFLEYLKDDTTVLERTPLEAVAALGQLNSYRHDGFWQCMDTLREKEQLEKLWSSGKAPWKVW